MNATHHNPQRIHPLVAIAAVAVTLFSLAGIAAIAGWLPTGKAAPDETGVAAVAAPASSHETKPAVQEVRTSEKPAAPKPAARPAPVQMAQAPAPAAAPAVAPVPAPQAVPAPAAAVCSNCGVIGNIREISQPGEGTGLGAVAGGVIGAIVGNQIGGGSGQKIATVAGAAGGAYAGHQIEKSQRKTTRYEVLVRMNDGTTRTVMMDMVPGWQIGERVRIENGTLVRD
jgi:outer membrane lipoprotein SlyB